jgi:hypothetical protein
MTRRSAPRTDSPVWGTNLPLPQPFIPEGEPYTLRPWADGSSPAKITEGRAGADVR